MLAKKGDMRLAQATIDEFGSNAARHLRQSIGGKKNLSPTGNPFVDTGLAVIAELAGKETFLDLTFEDIWNVFGDGKEIAEINSRLKSFTLVFGNNGPLYQPPQDPKNEPGKYKELRMPKYSSILKNLLEQAEKSNESEDSDVCEVCGEFPKASLELAYSQIQSASNSKKQRKHEFGRDFFPLIGSLRNDAQALPAGSRMFNLCGKCAFAVNYIPLGTMLLNGRLIVFENAHDRFVHQIIARIVHENRQKVSLSNKVETMGQKQPSGFFVDFLVDTFYEMKKKQKRKNTEIRELNIWQFSNSGTGATCDILRIPSTTVEFLYEAVYTQELRTEIKELVRYDNKNINSEDNKFLSCIKAKKDYFGLYPYKTYGGADIKLFTFYLSRILSIGPVQLRRTQQLAKKLFPESKKEQKKYLKSDFFKEIKNKNIIKGKIVELLERGEFLPEDYYSIFPITSVKPFTISNEGWRILEYMFHHLNEVIPELEHNGGENNMKLHPKIKEAAELYFNDYVETRGIKKFKKDILDEFKRNSHDLTRLQNILLSLCEKHEGFGPEEWDSFWHDLSHDENGNFRGYDLLFQFRLILTELYRQNITKKEDDK